MTKTTPHPSAHLLCAIADGLQMQQLVDHHGAIWHNITADQALRILSAGTDDWSAILRLAPPARIVDLENFEAATTATEMVSAAVIVAKKNRRIAELEERVQELGQMARDCNTRRVVELETQLNEYLLASSQALLASWDALHRKKPNTRALPRENV